MNEPSQEIQVLVVDDERDIRDGCERILLRKGCRVSKASNGKEGLDLLTKERFSIVLLDLKMPGMDGMEALLRIRESWPDTLVIVITGYATIETAIEAMKRGAYDFIPKPFRPDQLRIVVDRAIEKKRLTEEAKRLEREKQRTLKDLNMEKSRTRTIIQALPDGVMVSTPDAHVALMNPAFARMLGVEVEFTPGEPVEHYIKDQGFRRMVIDTSRGVPPTEKSGTFDVEMEGDKFFRALSTPVLGEDGVCLGAVTVLTDITQLKLLDKLKSEFVAKVSHELRSPLSTIQQQLAMVLNDLVGDVGHEQRTMLSRAKEKTQGLIALIGDILDLSRMESGHVFRENRPLDLGEILRNIVKFQTSKARGKRQTLTLSVPEEGLPHITGDSQALEILFSNLVTNAILYTENGGKIEVTASPENDRLRVEVKDNGFGIEERHQKKIFEKFYRVKNEQTRHITGTGLGLAIVKGFVDAIGGTIELESEPGKGSTFRVLLPMGPADKEADG